MQICIVVSGKDRCTPVLMKHYMNQIILECFFLALVISFLASFMSLNHVFLNCP
jgi:hypothetical protein